mmetsp:Transcript_24006/g.77455  ORF Transcript_24006/g.77455 Transcript_24006/m.77455 type:complete len:243 (-) Transcript_24006:193-921(-)
MPALTCSTRAGFEAGSRKRALRSAAAMVRLRFASCSSWSCDWRTRPRRGGGSGAGLPSTSACENRKRVRLCDACSSSRPPSRTGAGSRYWSACPSPSCAAPAGRAARGAEETTPPAPRGISNQKTTALARPSSTTLSSSAHLSGLMGGAVARKSKPQTTAGRVSGRRVRRACGSSRQTRRRVGDQSSFSAGEESIGTPVSASTCTAIAQTRAAGGSTAVPGRSSSSALRLLSAVTMPLPSSV